MPIWKKNSDLTSSDLSNGLKTTMLRQLRQLAEDNDMILVGIPEFFTKETGVDQLALGSRGGYHLCSARKIIEGTISVSVWNLKESRVIDLGDCR